MRDVIIIGAGVVGASVARELSAFGADVLVLEKECEMCMGTSKANSALVHAGFDAKPGSNKAKFNVEGSRRMEKLCRDLDVPYSRDGALVLAFSEEEGERLRELYDRGVINGVEQMELLTAEEVRRLEPHISGQVTGALYARTAALVCPFLLTIALCENACENGVDFAFDEVVTAIEKMTDMSGNISGYRVQTEKNIYQARNIVNCAGVYADKLHNMVSSRPCHITPVKGEYCLLDKSEKELVNHTLFRVPSQKGKGVLITRTVHGNLLLGPTAEAGEDRASTATTAEGLGRVLEETKKMAEGIEPGKIITSFAGLRAHEDGGDFVIGEAEGAEHFYDALGIESPGLSAAPAIGAYLAEQIAGGNGYARKPFAGPEDGKRQRKDTFCPYRKGIPAFADMTNEERNEIIRQKPAYGNVICRCEEITEGEILEAIHRPLGARTLDGLKRRVRAGMGRCQSGFCMPKLVEILARELGKDVTEITKSGGDSGLLMRERSGGNDGTV